MMELSVVICTKDPRHHYFRRVLEALRSQTFDMQKWELLVVDNASKERLEGAWDLSWHPHARHIREEQPGIVAARQRGIKEIASDLLVFVDDDNVLGIDYLTRVAQLKRDWPALGVWGSGCIIPEFEIEPPQHLKEFLPILALREVKSARWSNTFAGAALNPEITPWGAGQCVRAEVGEAYCRVYSQSKIQVPSRNIQLDLASRLALRFFSRWSLAADATTHNTRISGGGGEDVETCLVACSLGLGMGIFPELRVTHLIPKERLSDNYILKMGEFVGASNLTLEYKWHGVTPRNPLSPRGLVGAAKQAVTNRGFRRRMYFAGVRAIIRARAIIAASQEKDLSVGVPEV
jgi:hypothetical protein